MLHVTAKALVRQARRTKFIGTMKPVATVALILAMFEQDTRVAVVVLIADDVHDARLAPSSGQHLARSPMKSSFEVEF